MHRASLSGGVTASHLPVLETIASNDSIEEDSSHGAGALSGREGGPAAADPSDGRPPLAREPSATPSRPTLSPRRSGSSAYLTELMRDNSTDAGLGGEGRASGRHSMRDSVSQLVANRHSRAENMSAFELSRRGSDSLVAHGTLATPRPVELGGMDPTPTKPVRRSVLSRLRRTKANPTDKARPAAPAFSSPMAQAAPGAVAVERRGLLGSRRRASK
jgi:hypothetical protein